MASLDMDRSIGVLVDYHLLDDSVVVDPVVVVAAAAAAAAGDDDDEVAYSMDVMLWMSHSIHD